jgi:isoprenylcysteine carboxyl methyltransferase (ICMT) family protein YpbQ
VARRTPIQLALLIVGVIVWGFGQRTDDHMLTWVGIAFFVAAFLLRFWKRDEEAREEPPK